MYFKYFNIAHDNLSLQRTREIIKIRVVAACAFTPLGVNVQGAQRVRARVSRQTILSQN